MYESVFQVGSFDEKNQSQKISCYCLFQTRFGLVHYYTLGHKFNIAKNKFNQKCKNRAIFQLNKKILSMTKLYSHTRRNFYSHKGLSFYSHCYDKNRFFFGLEQSPLYLNWSHKILMRELGLTLIKKWILFPNMTKFSLISSVHILFRWVVTHQIIQKYQVYLIFFINISCIFFDLSTTFCLNR